MSVESQCTLMLKFYSDELINTLSVYVAVGLRFHIRSYIQMSEMIVFFVLGWVGFYHKTK